MSAALLSLPAPQVGAANSANAAYLKIDGGANIMQDATVEGINGTTFSPIGLWDVPEAEVKSFDAELDTGFRLGLIAGYNLNEWVALEFESGFMYNGIKDSDDAWLGSVPLMANVVFRFENETKLVPYIGGGGGGALTMFNDSYDSDSDFVYAWQAKAGVAYNLNDNVSVELVYKLFATGDQEYFDAFKVKDVMAHFIGIGFSCKF